MKTLKKFGAILLSAIAIASCSALTVGAAGFEDVHGMGDFNGDGRQSIRDVTMLQKHLAGQITLSSAQLSKADTNYDGLININDATHIQETVAGSYVSLVGKKGVDISYSNGDIDLQAVKDAGYEFVMIRLGYGDDETDQDDWQFEKNVKKCEELGLPWGAYIYSYALTVREAQSEVRHTLRLLEGKKPTLPIVFDLEDGDGYKERHGMPSNEMLVNITTTYLKGVADAGYYPMLYTGYYWLYYNLADSTIAEDYDIWFAQWNSECDYYGDNLGMWQYGGEVNYLDDPVIDGVGIIDQNFAYKDYPLIIKNGGYNNW